MNIDIKKFKKRIVRGAILKSALAALIIACGVLLVTALASWIFGFKAGLWIAIGLFFATFFGAAILFYFLKYRPTAKGVAREIDAIGLEERLITMMELEGDNSDIAKMQRADTEKALKTADHTLIKVAASVIVCALVGVFALFGAGALTVNSLYVAGVIPSGIEAASYQVESRQFSMKYSASKSGGKIYFWQENGIGEEVTEAIVVKEGEDAPAVIAVPDEGYAFTGWSDGVSDPYRRDSAVTRGITVQAVFASIDAPPGLDDDTSVAEGQDGDYGDADMPPDDPDRPINPEGAGGNGHSDANKQVNDGKTYYGDEFSDAYDDAMGRLGDGSNIPEDLQGGITDYLGSIGKDGSDQGGEGGN